MGRVWFPLKNIISWTARKHGFIDPISILARLESFGQPAEVAQPVELLRAGVILHARGLINARVIQHNLDWVWPWWVECQFDPRDESFIPRAFSITHVNLTHRNWTALGLPGRAIYPLVDPRGLVTPHYDGGSLDVWMVDSRAGELIPAREGACHQSLEMGDTLSVITETERGPLRLHTEASVGERGERISTQVAVTAHGLPGSSLVVALRPYNPEGISFIESVDVATNWVEWWVNGETAFHFDTPPEAILLSKYTQGDVYRSLIEQGYKNIPRSGSSAIERPARSIVCSVGMATGAAIFPLPEGHARVTINVPSNNTELEFDSSQRLPQRQKPRAMAWSEIAREGSLFDLGDNHLNYLCRAASRTLALLSPGDIFPGPYTYRRFWFRDAAMMLHGLLAAGIIAPAEACIERFPLRQTPEGYLYSQEGEWDSNGMVLWVIERFCAVTDRRPRPEWLELVRRGADWIAQKRLPITGELRHRGLLPAGFSAEHLGPNDFYFWDDFWGIAGLESAATLFEAAGRPAVGADYRRIAREFRGAVLRAIGAASAELGYRAIPASPYRRLDAGAIGSIVCAYPLRILPPHDPALVNTVEFLLRRCCLDGAFFQDMIHSGLNPYLSLQLAQVLRRRNDVRAHEIFRRIGALASPTGQWPEAIHPRTLGGCMGDGQHGWAAAEWMCYVHMMFVAEEGEDLLLCSGIPLEWLAVGKQLKAERLRTRFGTVSVAITGESTGIEVSIAGDWYRAPPSLRLRFLGGEERAIPTGSGHTFVPYPQPVDIGGAVGA